MTGGTEVDAAFNDASDASDRFSRLPNVADRYADLLKNLPKKKREGFIGRISQGFYDGWRPSRREVADLVAVELRLLTVDDCMNRQRQWRLGREPEPNFISLVTGGIHPM